MAWRANALQSGSLNFMAQTKILITGATGLIGRQLAQRLAKQAAPDTEIRALVRSPHKAQHLAELGVKLILGDLADSSSIQQAMAGCQIVYHAAAWVGEDGDPSQVWATNVTGTQYLIEAALVEKVKRFVHLSSCAVYGSLQEFEIDETTPMFRTGNLYADTKIAAEEFVMHAYEKRNLPVTVARPSQVYGPNSNQFTIRPIQAIQSGKMMLIDGGRHLCKPIYIDNLVDGLLLCASHPAAVGEVFNFSDGPPVSWHDFFGAYGQMLGKKHLPSVPYPVAWSVALFYEAQALLRGGKANLNRRVLDALRSSNSFSNQKAQRRLGWQPKVDLAEGMRRTEIWLREAGYLSS